MSILIILPNSLFKQIDKMFTPEDTTIFVYEHPVYFTMYNYHKMKLVLHRSSMKYYYEYLKQKFPRVIYINFDKNIGDVIGKHKSAKIYIYDPVDHFVEADMTSICRAHKCELQILQTQLFMETTDELLEYSVGKQRFNHATFYKWQRKRLRILMVGDMPVGSKWNYDNENRLPFPNSYKAPPIPTSFPASQQYINAAITYVNKHFASNPGNPSLFLPINHQETAKFFDDFLKHRLINFGKYEDAVNDEIPFGSHSVMSPLLNIGLITPKYIIERVLKHYKKYKLSLSSVEGYIRQVIGWRSYCRLLYITRRAELVEESNLFKHHNLLNDKWYYGGDVITGIYFIDDMIRKVINLGYLHHIERLMYIGNFALLTNVDPKSIFNWFQCMFIDSYHVFMYPNVYGMSQYSAGDIMMSRPYFSSASYIARMSNHKKALGHDIIRIGKILYQWYELWDILFYNFVYTNRRMLAKNYATATFVAHLNKKSAADIRAIRTVARAYLNY